MAFVIDLERFAQEAAPKIRITVAGVGRFGCDVVNALAGMGIEGVDYLAVHSDPQVLAQSLAQVKLRVGGGASIRGQVNDEERKAVASRLDGANMVILVAGMGKGTGTWLAPGIALVARNMSILTFGIVTTPFACECGAKSQSAEEGIASLRKYADALVVVENDKLAARAGEDALVDEVFAFSGELVSGTVKSIAEVLTNRGNIDISFNDFAGFLSNAGASAIGLGSASGEGSALKAVTAAFKSLQFSPETSSSLAGMMVSISGKVTMKDLDRAMRYLQEQVGDSTRIINAYVNQSAEPGLTTATLIATGVKMMETAPPPPDKQHPRWPVSLPGITNKGIRPPAYILKGLVIDGVQGLNSPATTPYRDRISKDSPETPAFERLIWG
jgi:cell division protein FtsZ